MDDPSPDLVQIVTNNLRHNKEKSIGSKETKQRKEEGREARLSKRLSAGHYGSAGGLIMSTTDISSSSSTTTSPHPSEEIEELLLNWKIQSNLPDRKIILHKQHSYKQASHSKNKKSFKISPPEILVQDLDDPKECASRLWHEDETFVEHEKIAEWLGQSKSLNSKTLNEYMNYFNFSTMRLDTAFRKMCSKLYFRAEAQQIERILEAFAKRYWQCNPKSILGSSDVVYAIVYSLLLLNTDLHVAQGNYTRMTRHIFVKNTMSTLRDQQKQINSVSINKSLDWEALIEAYLKDLYVSVKNYQILQPIQHQQMDDHDLFLATGSNNKRISIMDIKRNLNTIIHKSSRESVLFLNEPVPRKSTSSFTRQNNSANNKKRRSSFASSHSAPNTLLVPVSPGMMNSASNKDEQHLGDLQLNNQPPYLKEGIVMRKHLLEKAGQKARYREWRECLLVIGQGELNMYNVPSPSDSRLSLLAKDTFSRKSMMIRTSLADTISKNYHQFNQTTNSLPQNNESRWTDYSQIIGTISLNHSLANPLPPPGYNRNRPFVFAIQESNGGVHLIHTSSNEQMIEWVNTCNYWSARQSKEPLQGGVSNVEYGWGSCLDDVILDLDAVENNEKVTGHFIHDPDKVHISHWIPPAPTMVSSVLDEEAQLESLQKYVALLNDEINEHREIKKKILVKFQAKSQNRSKALQNWEAKSTYMLHEIIKYQNYCNALENGISKHKKQDI
ncbi:uncharacterized protein BX663DRAFT_485418 [Cokeromyces recurvatus]|uniref:uncharacterized protein n=1 Tax=Cokeromyces recurvatus TaxID=90255 RepID=UPI0022209734|nr:uncharacterized protein BX663DRAFT_485418 [Cokeromyces recurvatus]KAI7903926.1 hypothetical protein BX663DRAFT_485418 [Cokeromyces recurvatus]